MPAAATAGPGSAPHPREALFGAGDHAPLLPVCDHYAGVEVRMRKSLELQRELGPVFDVTLDAEDGAPIGGEAEHAALIAELLTSRDNVHGRVGARVHPVDHPAFEADVETLVGRAGQRVAYLMLPKVNGAADVERACRAVDMAAAAAGLERRIPLHALVETHAALREVDALAAHPRIESLSFGLMDFVSAHRGAIPGSAMTSAGQFSHPLVVRAKLEIAAACHGHAKVPSHCVVTEFNADDARARRGDARGPRVRLHAHVEHPPEPDPADRRGVRPERGRGRGSRRDHRAGDRRAVGADPARRRAPRPRQLPLFLGRPRTRPPHRRRAAGRPAPPLLRRGTFPMIRLLHPLGAAVALAFGLAALPAASATASAKATKPAATKSAAAKPARPAKADSAKDASDAKPATKTARGARKAAPAAAAALVIPDATPDQVTAAGMVYYGRYECEFDQTVHIDKSARNAAYVDVVAGKSQWLMKPVLSSTGAIRLEDVRGETLMVQIASKSMLLNVKSARRIVDECISPSQRALIDAAKLAKAAELAAAKAGGDAAAGSAAPAPVLLVAPGSLPPPSARPAPVAPAAPASATPPVQPAAASPSAPLSTSEVPAAAPAVSATSAALPASVSEGVTAK